ncbi:MAG: YidC/Oxa1 family membrane protein insertase, partial [Ktedonobacterales bacterium]
MGNALQLVSYIFYYPIYNVLMALYEAFAKVFHGGGAFALAIVVLTLGMRACLIPLTRKQLKSSREMQVLAPKLKALQAEHRGEPQALMAAQRALYKEHGVSPASGCLPLVIQMPFIYALYGAFNTVLRGSSVTTRLAHINKDLYPFVPHLHAIPNSIFLWVDLAKPDPLHILPILAAILTFLQLRMAMPVRAKRLPGQPADPTSQATGMMQYVMPFVTLFIGLTFPAGLALYWCVTTTFSAVQQYFISGWGSLFVGVPGMEHMVPAPKAPVTPAIAGRALGRPVGSSVGAARGLTAAPVVDEEPGGLRGFIRQARQQLFAAQQTATAETDRRLAERDAKNGGRNGATANGATANGATANGATANGATANGATANGADDSFAVARPENPNSGNSGNSGNSSRRQRPARTGPVLIKPPSNGATPGELPEHAIARDGVGGIPEGPAPKEASVAEAKPPKAELPEVTIARLAKANGGKNGNGNGNGNGN